VSPSPLKDNWTFTIEDLNKIYDYYETKLKEVDKFRNYSKLQRKTLSEYEKISKILNFAKLLIRRKKLTDRLLDILNGEELKERNVCNYYNQGKVMYLVNKYFLKARISLNYLKFKNKKIDPLCFLPIIIQKLIANKIIENKIVGSLPNRNKAIKGLIKFLKKNLRNLEKFQVIRADFKSYTLNIRRKRIFEILEGRNVPQNIISLIKGFVEDSTIESKIFKNFNIEKLFRKIGYMEDYEFDCDFKSVIGREGILTGTPLANILGQIYLEEFDKKMKELIENEGFYIRYFDDLILIVSDEKARKVMNEISSYLSRFYKIRKNKIKEIFRIDLKQNLSEAKFEFLGYKFEIKDKNLKISIRYKTIKKFVYKFIYEYKPKDKSYLVAKNYYLFSWLGSFKHINDYKLLEKIYLNIILPDIYLNLKKFKIEKEFHYIKKFYRPNAILRIVRKGDKEKIIEKLESLKNYINS
jgi:hypothetical protein